VEWCDAWLFLAKVAYNLNYETHTLFLNGVCVRHTIGYQHLYDTRRIGQHLYDTRIGHRHLYDTRKFF